MKQFDNPLDHVRIAAPCNANWDQMVGTERARFCAQCNLNVYNLSSMTRAEAEHLIARNEGRLCVRYFRRSDGSILTQNCPVGLRAIRRKLAYVSRVIASAVLTFFAGIGIYELSRERNEHVLMGVVSVEPPRPLPVIHPAPTPVLLVAEPVMGKMMIRPSADSTHPSISTIRPITRRPLKARD